VAFQGPKSVSRAEPAKRPNSREDVRSHSRGAMRPRFDRTLVPLKDRGRRESRVSDAPAAPCALVESTWVVTTGSPDQSGFPRAMVLTAYFVLSPATGLFCHRRLADIGAIHNPVGPEASPQNLTPASGRQDHTTSPSATCVVRLHAVNRSRAQRTALRPRLRADAIASTASRPRVRDDREPPLWGRDGRTCRDDLPDGESGIFFESGLDTDLPDGR
jgi:hypothetical protein